MAKYNGNFSNREDVASQFGCVTGGEWQAGGRTPEVVNDDFPSEDQIFYAVYEAPSYEGWAWVLFERDGKLYEVSGSHCSCYGLEGQWSPEETSWEAISIRKADDEYGLPHEAVELAKIAIDKNN